MSLTLHPLLVPHGNSAVTRIVSEIVYDIQNRSRIGAAWGRLEQKAKEQIVADWVELVDRELPYGDTT